MTSTAVCYHQLSHRSGKLSIARTGLGSDREPFCLLPALSPAQQRGPARGTGSAGAHPSPWGRVLTCLLEASRAWRLLQPCLKAPPTCHVPPAPACPAVGRFQQLKIALEETQVWGLEGDESGEGRQLYSQTRWGGRWGRGIPHREARGCQLAQQPATESQPERPPVCRRLAALHGRKAGCIGRGSASPWADQKSADAPASKRHRAAPGVPAECTESLHPPAHTDVWTWLWLSWGPGASMYKVVTKVKIHNESNFSKLIQEG